MREMIGSQKDKKRDEKFKELFDKTNEYLENKVTTILEEK